MIFYYFPEQNLVWVSWPTGKVMDRLLTKLFTPSFTDQVQEVRATCCQHSEDLLSSPIGFLVFSIMDSSHVPLTLLVYFHTVLFLSRKREWTGNQKRIGWESSITTTKPALDYGTRTPHITCNRLSHLVTASHSAASEFLLSLVVAAVATVGSSALSPGCPTPGVLVILKNVLPMKRHSSFEIPFLRCPSLVFPDCCSQMGEAGGH